MTAGIWTRPRPWPWLAAMTQEAESASASPTVAVLAAALLFPILSLSASATTDEARASAPKALAATAPAPTTALPTSLRPVSAEAALNINRAIPFSSEPNVPALPFVLAGDDTTRARALECLTAAIYYEAGREQETGKEAVAQVVLNRVRHRAYPASVCGVVFEGSTQPPGCQFTFTCDGSLTRPPDRAAWALSEKVADEALAGKVFAPVGLSTHYHADYVVPYWATGLAKVAQVGAHIFYRLPGAWGEPGSFRDRYAGKEMDPAILRAAALMTSGLWPRDTAAVDMADVQLKADPKLQLLGVIRLLANTKSGNPDPYETEIRAYFSAASDAPAVQLLRDAQSDGSAGDAARFAEAVSAFGENNDWNRFFRTHRRFYDQSISSAESKLGAAVAAWNAYTGIPVKLSTVAAAVGPGGNLPVCLVDKSRPLRELWVPAGGEVRGAADIFLASGLPTGMLEPGARSAGVDSNVQAQVIRAIFVRIEALSSGESAGQKAVSREIGLGHALVPEIARRLTSYEGHRAQYPTLASFLPQLLKDLPVTSGAVTSTATDGVAVQSKACKPGIPAVVASAAGEQPSAGAPQSAARIRFDAAAVRVRETL